MPCKRWRWGAATGDEAVVLAGGQSLLILVRQRLVRPALVVSLQDVAEVVGVGLGPAPVLGAMTTYRAVSGHVDFGRIAPTLPRAAGSVGSVHIRNRGTVGGSLAHADPAGDVPTVLMALGDAAVLVSAAGTRSVRLDAFVVGLFETVIEPGELLTSVRVDEQPLAAGHGYRRFSFHAGEYPLCVAACRLDPQGAPGDAVRVSVGGGDLYPRRYPEIEQALVPLPSSSEEVRRRLRDVRDLFDPVADVRGSGPWKARVVEQTLLAAIDDAVRDVGSRAA